MARNRPTRLLTGLCLLVLLAGITAPVFADPAAGAPPSLGALWRAFTGWLEGVIATMAGDEANLIPWVDPRGQTSTSTGGETNLIPFADPYG